MRALACGVNRRRLGSSASRVEKKLPAMALWQASPADPAENRTPASVQRLPNVGDVCCVASTGRRDAGPNWPRHGVRGLGGRFPAERPARPAVGRGGRRREVVRTVRAEAGSFRETLAQRPVGVLARAALPWAVRVAEANRRARADPQPGAAGRAAPSPLSGPRPAAGATAPASS